MNKVILLIACLFANTAIAQVLVTLRQPPPNQLGATDIWNLTVTNQSPAEVELYLEGTVDEAQDGRIVEGTCGAFKLKANESKNITANNIPGGGKYNWRNGKYQEVMARTGSAGTGEYTVCIYAKNTAGGQLTQACMRHSIAVLSPPTLVSPSDGEKLPPGQQTTFTWLPATPTPGNASYNIRIVEVMGTQTPVEAMKKNNPFYQKDGLNSTMHVYPTAARPFVQGNTYAWQVTCGSAQSEAMAFKILYDGTTITVDLTPLPCLGCCFEMKIGGNFTSSMMNSFFLSCTGATPTILSVTATANTTIVAQQPNSFIIKHSGGPFESGFIAGTICFQQVSDMLSIAVAWSTNGGTTFMNPPDLYSIPCSPLQQNACLIEMGVLGDQNPLNGPVDFGSVPVNSSSSKLVTLKNTGTCGELIVSPLALSLPPFTCAFVSTSGTVMTGNAPYTAYTLLPNQIVTYSVTFNPTTVGAHTKTWYVAQNSANYAAQNPFPIQLTGSGTSPACPSGKIVRTYVGSVAAANDITNSLVCDFGTQTIGSYVKTVIITNTSAASCGPITITPAALSGGQFTFSTTGTMPSGGWTIAPGGTKEFLVHYDCILGPSTQNWTISHNAGNIPTPYEIILQGTGISGQTHTMKVTGDATTMAAGVNYVHNSSYDFGNTITAVPRNKIFKIWSYGDASLLIDPITITPFGSPFTLLTTPPPPWTLAVNLSGQPTGKAFTIRYLPTATGSHAAQLNISNNSTNNPTTYVINLTGECTGSAKMKVTQDATSTISSPIKAHNTTHTFPNTLINASSTKTFRIWNMTTSQIALQIDNISTEEPFQVLPAGPAQISAGTSYDIVVTFFPQAQYTNVQKQLKINNQSTNEPNTYIINLKGTSHY